MGEYLRSGCFKINFLFLKSSQKPVVLGKKSLQQLLEKSEHHKYLFSSPRTTKKHVISMKEFYKSRIRKQTFINDYFLLDHFSAFTRHFSFKNMFLKTSKNLRPTCALSVFQLKSLYGLLLIFRSMLWNLLKME